MESSDHRTGRVRVPRRVTAPVFAGGSGQSFVKRTHQKVDAEPGQVLQVPILTSFQNYIPYVVHYSFTPHGECE